MAISSTLLYERIANCMIPVSQIEQMTFLVSFDDNATDFIAHAVCSDYSRQLSINHDRRCNLQSDDYDYRSR